MLTVFRSNITLYYYTVAEMHIFLSEVGLSRLASLSRVFKSVGQLTPI